MSGIQAETKLNKRTMGTPRHEVSSRLRQMALDHGPGMRLPATRKLTGMLGTSLPTLNSVLDELEAKNVICREDRSGIYVSPKLHTKSIIVLYDTAVSDQPGLSPFWGMLWSGLVKEAQKRAESGNLEFTFRTTTYAHDPESRLPLDVMRSLGDGLVHGMVGIGLTNAAAALAAARDIPLVSFAGGGHWQVANDIVREVRAGVDALVDRGCRSIELWRGVITDGPFGSFIESQTDEEVEAFKDCLAARNLPFGPDAVRSFWDTPDDRLRWTLQQHGYRLAMKAFGPDATRHPDGLLILDDMITSGALFALQDLGLSLEKTVKIATIANVGSTVLFGHERSLILLEHDPRSIAVSLLDALDVLLDGRELDANPIHMPLKMRFPEDYPGVLFSS
jgi:DNA-binding LacI/PurR family transcriptional regulator